MNIYPDLKFTQTTDHKPPTKKVLYFSDGTLEVDEDDAYGSEESITSHTGAHSNSHAVNPQQLPWLPWMWHYTLTAGTKALEVCDYVGESLASFFGITTPKYQFEINEYMKIKKAVSPMVDQTPLTSNPKHPRDTPQNHSWEEEESQNEMEMKRWNKCAQLQEGVTNALSQPGSAFNPI